MKSLSKFPEFIIDLENDFEVVSEAKKLNIPIVAIIDNNSKFINQIDYPILSNTGSILPFYLIISLVIETLKNN